MLQGIQERFLHFTWKYKLFDSRTLKSSDGLPIEIEHPGTHNFNSGPDFFNARIKVGDTLWFGPVEIHLKSSDYIKHRHESDPAYDSIILHVVAIHDVPVPTLELKQIPTLVISPYIFPFVRKEWEQLMNHSKKIPCGGALTEYDPHQKIILLQEKGISRILRKSEWIKTALQTSGFDWEETFHRIQARAFGMQVNDDAFEWLARETPSKLISRLSYNPELIKDLILGQAGFLSQQNPEHHHAYSNYAYLKITHRLNALPAHAWKHARMRPAGFPETRVLQWGEFLIRFPNFISRLFDTRPEILFSELMHTSEKLRQESINFPTPELLRNLAINCWSLMLYLTGTLRGKEHLKDYALEWLERFKAEDNAIIRQYKRLGFTVANALESQGLLELYKESCTKKACLDCKVFATIAVNKTKDLV